MNPRLLIVLLVLLVILLVAGMLLGGAGGEDKGAVGIAMPTKSSSRWISDGESMVKAFTDAGYTADLQYAEDDIPTQLSQIENMGNVQSVFVMGIIKQTHQLVW